MTIDLAEGHDAHREAMRVQMAEPYRTMLGHLRHEVGHYYWQVIVRGHRPGAGTSSPAGSRRCSVSARSSATSRPTTARPCSGTTRRGRRRTGPGGTSAAYATAHPWEDWAETFAHYLHIRDTLQTAAAYGMVVTGPDDPGPAAADLVALPTEDAGAHATIHAIVGTWLPLTYALNAVNRSMGKGDLYPFVLTPPVIAKLGFVHELVAG